MTNPDHRDPQGMPKQSPGQQDAHRQQGAEKRTPGQQSQGGSGQGQQGGQPGQRDDQRRDPDTSGQR